MGPSVPVGEPAVLVLSWEADHLGLVEAPVFVALPVRELGSYTAMAHRSQRNSGIGYTTQVLVEQILVDLLLEPSPQDWLDFVGWSEAGFHSARGSHHDTSHSVRHCPLYSTLLPVQ